jgi:hypothetical protein
MFGNASNVDFFNQTTLHPFGMIAIVLLGICMLLAPRRYALLPLLIMTCFVPSAQRIVIATLDFNFVRIMVLFGWFRIIFRNELAGFRWKSLDSAVVVWAMCATILGSLLHTTVAQTILQLGRLYDAIGLYFVCRCLVRNWADIFTLARATAVISVPVAALFVVENMTGRNMFSFLGGVPEFTEIRDGRLRCQGAFSHPILAGSFWAGMLPLMLTLWWARGVNRGLALVGAACAVVIVMTTASATPVYGLMVGFAGVALYAMRRWMAWIRIVTVVGLVLIQCAMVSPIWHLMSRMSIVSGSTGWYRFKLMDDFVRHFNDWWLLGTESRATWFDGGNWAITNYYVAQGVGGGLLTLVLFVAIIVVGFRAVGRTNRRMQRKRFMLIPSDMPQRSRTARAAVRRMRSIMRSRMSWALGAALFAHCVIFMSTTYFGQIIMLWYLTLAMIGSMAPVRMAAPKVAARLTRVRSSGANRDGVEPAAAS